MSTIDRLPTLVCLIGPPAVGKMTVGQELCRHTGFKMFYSHAVADMLTPYFPFGTPAYAKLGRTWRRTFLEAACGAGLDLVMTLAWRFDVPADEEEFRNGVQSYIDGGRVLCVELQAPLEERLERNLSENRMRHKNQDWVTDDYLKEIHSAHRYDSGGAFPLDLPHLQVDTGDLSAAAAADRIIQHFGLAHLDG